MFLLLLGIYVTITRGHFWSTDEVTVYQQTRSLWEHGDLDTASLPNSLPGRGGRYYGVYGAGQSVLALPFYGVGKAVRLTLEHVGARSWIDAIAGPVLGERPDRVWGGEVEIFFVNLFNAVVVALLCTVFFFFNLRLGVAPRWAVASTFILALATHLTGFAGGFFQHGAEALFVLWSFYLLYGDSVKSRRQTRVAAGSAAGAMLLIRINTAVLLPALTAYLVFHAWRRLPSGSWRDRLAGAARQAVPFLVPVGVALLAVAGVNAWKFGAFGIRGAYAHTIPFSTPLLLGLYGNLFSVGQSIFLFSPILFLAPWYFRGFGRRYPAETAAILAMSVSSLLLYSKVYLWHGQWCFGPRYLVHLVPLLVLPLGGWLETAGRRIWAAVVPLVVAGLVVEALHVLVNVSYVYYHEGYRYEEPFGYLFIPAESQLAAHWRALVAWDSRVDTWMIDTARQYGAHVMVPIAICCLWGLAWGARQVWRSLQEAEGVWAKEDHVVPGAGIEPALPLPGNGF